MKTVNFSGRTRWTWMLVSCPSSTDGCGRVWVAVGKEGEDRSEGW